MSPSCERQQSKTRGCLRLLIFLAFVACTCAEPDARVCAIRRQTLEGLKGICQKASIEHADDADAETLRALVYKVMQGEIPGNAEVKLWPGPGEPVSKMHEMIFKKLDMNHDGRLAQAEMQPMIDQVNAEAKAKGEAEHDLFKTLDRNADGFVSPEEAEEFFKHMAAGFGGEKQQVKNAVKPESQDAAQVAATLFNNLDADKDDKLSKDEFKDILEKHEAEMKAKGEDGGDFWTSLDTNSDGYIDRSEADTFFKQMYAALSSQKTKDEV